MKTRLLLVDDDASILASLAERFEARGYAIRTAAAGDEALSAIRDGVDVVLLDLQLPRGDGIEVLRTIEAEGLLATVIVLTAHGTIERAVSAMRAGAWDFLEKPFEPSRLEECVARASERAQLVRANRALRAEGVASGMVCADPAMERVLELARRAAPSDSSLLLLGESGTGKEVLARAIHAWSARADGPFVAVNCAALSESLLEAELFGHEQGAFTGADARREGKFEAAHGGTLLLDEIGDTTPTFQVKLLRVLQERSFERVGGTRPVSVDLRVIAATHRDLRALIEAGDFREDLFFRLNVIALELPPLRERPADVRALTQHFLAECAASAGRAGLRIAPEVVSRLEAYAWPGNARELRNVVERAVVLCEGETIEPLDLPPEVADAQVSSVTAPPSDAGFHMQVEGFRRELLRRVLDECDGHQTRAAERLGLQRSYLARMLRKYGLRPGDRGPA